MGLLIVEDLLEDLSYVLVDSIVNTQLNPLGSPVAIGTQVVTPGVMTGIYPGVQLLIGTGVGREIIQVVSTTATTFTATFTLAHDVTDAVIGATFPAGQPDHPIYTQSEILGYLTEAQNDFLLSVMPVYTTGLVKTKANIPVYATPVDCILAVRAAMSGVELSEVAQSDLDWMDAGLNSASNSPQYWYRDNINFQSFGVSPPPRRVDLMELFYTKNGGSSLSLNNTLVVPDVMAFILKYMVLSRCFNKDGEQRDPDRSRIAQRMYDFWVMICRKFLLGIDARVNRSEDSIEPLIKTMRT